jgi:hypothetical protein
MERWPDEPEGYRELCARLQQEKDPHRFSALVDEIDVLLTEHARRTTTDLCCDEQLQKVEIRRGATLRIAPIRRED